MADETLLTLANEVRGKTLRLLEGVPDDLARFTGSVQSPSRGPVPSASRGPGLSNSTLWHAGHALMLVEHLCIIPATGERPRYPQGWFEMFSWQSRPAAVKPAAWPPLSQVVELLREQSGRLIRVIESLSPRQLAEVIDPVRNRTLRYSIVHGLHDEASHQGEIYLLRKLYAQQSAAAAGTGS